MPRRILRTLNFEVLKVKKFKFGSIENLGYGCRNGSVSHQVQIFGERSVLKKCSILFGGLSSSIHFLIFKFFFLFLAGVKGRNKIANFLKVFKMVIWAKVVFICVQFA